MPFTYYKVLVKKTYHAKSEEIFSENTLSVFHSMRDGGIIIHATEQGPGLDGISLAFNFSKQNGCLILREPCVISFVRIEHVLIEFSYLKANIFQCTKQGRKHVNNKTTVKHESNLKISILPVGHSILCEC